MTVKELKEILANIPDDAEVCHWTGDVIDKVEHHQDEQGDFILLQ